MLGQAFEGGKAAGSALSLEERADRLMALTERLSSIGRAFDMIRYDNELVTELGEALKTLGAAKEAVIAELKTA